MRQKEPVTLQIICRRFLHGICRTEPITDRVRERPASAASLCIANIGNVSQRPTRDRGAASATVERDK